MPVTGFYNHKDEPEEEKPEPYVRQYDSPQARKPKPDHPWRHMPQENYYTCSDARHKAMMACGTMIAVGMQKDKTFVVSYRPWVNLQISKHLKCAIEVGIRNKVYIMDRYLPRLAEMIGPLLEQHHWKFITSEQTRYTITYFIRPDWDYWIFNK